MIFKIKYFVIYKYYGLLVICGIYVDIDFKIFIWCGVFNVIKLSIIWIWFWYLFEYVCVVVVMTGVIWDIEIGDCLILMLNFM